MNELSTEKTMTVREVAEILSIGESSIKRAIEKLRPEMGELLKNSQGGYLLNEKQVTAVKLNLEKRFEVKTDLEKALIIQQAAIYQQEIIQSMQVQIENKNKQLEHQKPAVDFYNAVTDSKDAIEMSQVAKVLDLDMGRNNLFKYLRSLKILRDNNEPYQAYIDRGYFRVIEQKYTTDYGETRISIKTLVYQKGLDFIRKILDRE